MEEKKTAVIIKPINQLNLFGYKKYFDFFYELDQKNKLPNSMILTGQKGLGKATFTYHFINYLLSKDEKYNYDKNNFTINKNNITHKLVQNQTHTNLFILDAVNEENIKIEQIRKLLLFLNKSTYHKDLKIVLLDNAEYLNINSSNALLKSIEEPRKNTYFFIINNVYQKIPNTIKSRCIDFKINFNFYEKKNIFNKIVQSYDLNFNESDLEDFLYFDTHGNLLNYLSCLSYFIELYKQKNDPKILNFISLFIHNFYNQLSLKNGTFINNYYRKLNKILLLIDNMKKYHLDKKNFIFSIGKIIKNER